MSLVYVHLCVIILFDILFLFEVQALSDPVLGNRLFHTVNLSLSMLFLKG